MRKKWGEENIGTKTTSQEKLHMKKLCLTEGIGADLLVKGTKFQKSIQKCKNVTRVLHECYNCEKTHK